MNGSNPGKLAGGNSQDNRSHYDFYSTPPECTHALMRYLQKHQLIRSPSEEVIWEPCCGTGAISLVLKEYGYSTYSADIRDTGFGVKEQNFLQVRQKMGTAIITNPPFYLADKFLERAMLLDVSLVVFLLKSNYFHAGSRVELFRKYPISHVLPLIGRPNFIPEKGGGSLLDFCWYVWKKDHTGPTIYDLLEKV